MINDLISENLIPVFELEITEDIIRALECRMALTAKFVVTPNVLLRKASIQTKFITMDYLSAIKAISSKFIRKLIFDFVLFCNSTLL